MRPRNVCVVIERHERNDDAGRTPNGERVQRLDRAGTPLDRAVRGRRVRAVVARVGVLDYPEYDRAELVTPETLRRVDSLVGKPVVVGHPAPDASGSQFVRPETRIVGHVASARFDEQAGEVHAELEITDSSVIASVASGELAEVSPGYLAPTMQTAGTWAGRRYDSVQGEREYNHVALLPPGGARCGAACSCRADSNHDLTRAMRALLERTDSMETERIDGIDYKIGSPEWRQAIAKRQQRVDAEMAKIADEKKALEESKTKADADLAAMTAERDAMKTKLAEIEKKLEELESPESMDARADARAKLLETARKVLGANFTAKRADGKAMRDLEIKVEVLKKRDEKIDSAKLANPVYVEARFDSETSLLSRVTIEPITPASPFTPAPAPHITTHADAGAGPSNPHTVGRQPPPSLEHGYQR